ncbi:MAG: TonB-dependent receptor plug domain-containing protein, partial [Gemmatimonadota bacterium]
FADPARPAADARSRENSASLRASVAGGGTHRRVEAGLELREDRGSGTDLEATTSRRDAALHAGLRWRPGAGALVLSPALRIDRLEMGTGAGQGDARSHSFLSPSLAAAVALRPGVSLRAFAGRAFRYPGFQSLAFVPGLGVRGNPHLREERSRDLELGLDWAPDPRVGASLAAYERRIDGPIVWLPDFRFVWSPRNLPRALVRGVDLAARWSSSAGLEATLAYTYAPARFDFPGNRHPLPYRPAHLGRLGMALERGAVHTAVDLRLTGRRHPTLAGTNALPAHAVLDWSLAWRRARSEHGELVLELALQNLLERRYEVVAGFPAAGRTLRVGARAALP